MEKIKNSKIAIISHDAGAAELLSFWIKNHKKNKYLFHIKGPAENVFRKNKVNFKNKSINKIIKISDFVLTGTSLKSNLEIRALKISRQLSKKSYSFIDHWINYKDRFKRSGKYFLPDVFLASDKYAFKILKRTFKNIEIKIVKNYFLESFKKIKRDKIYKNSILFLSSNNDLNIKKKFISDKEIVEKLIKKIIKIFPSYNNFIIRPHPTEKKNKYSFLYKKNFKNLKIKIDNYKKIESSLKKARIVIGYDTMGIVVADSMRIRSYNIDLQSKYEKNVIPKSFYYDLLKI